MLKNGGRWLLAASFLFVVVTFLFTQYGYRLPAEENVFYNVHFYYIRGRIFTYPLDGPVYIDNALTWVEWGSQKQNLSNLSCHSHENTFFHLIAMSGDAKIKSNTKLLCYAVSKSFSRLSTLKVHFYQPRTQQVTLRHHIHLTEVSLYLYLR